MAKLLHRVGRLDHLARFLETPVTTKGWLALSVTFQKRARRHALDASVERGVVLVEPSLEEEAGNRAPVRCGLGVSGITDRLDLGRQHESALVVIPEQGLHTKAVARGKQPTSMAVVYDKCPHSVQARQTLLAPLLICRQQHFGVAVGPERMSQRAQLVAQFDEVVDRAVEDDHMASVRTDHRLMTGFREVEDGEASERE